MGKPNLTPIREMLKKGKSFEMTGEQYKQKTAADFPKNKSYAKTKSAVARCAAEYGFRIEIVPLQIKFIKE